MNSTTAGKRWFVIKIGGELANNIPRLANTVGKAVSAFLSEGFKVAVVHGGGPQASDLSKRLGIETRQVGGQRVTDAQTLEVMKMTLAGQVSVSVAQAFRLAGVNALCTSGVSAGLVDATKRPPRLSEGFYAAARRVGEAEAANLVLHRPRGILENALPSAMPVPPGVAEGSGVTNVDPSDKGRTRSAPVQADGDASGGFVDRLRRLFG